MKTHLELVLPQSWLVIATTGTRIQPSGYAAATQDLLPLLAHMVPFPKLRGQKITLSLRQAQKKLRCHYVGEPFLLYVPSSCIQSMFFPAFLPLQLSSPGWSACLPSFPPFPFLPSFPFPSFLPSLSLPSSLPPSFPTDIPHTQGLLPTQQHLLPALWQHSFDGVKHSTGVPVSSLVLPLDSVFWTGIVSVSLAVPTSLPIV